MLWKVFLVTICTVLGDLQHVLETPLAGYEQLLGGSTAEDTPSNMPIAKGTQVPPAFSSLLISIVSLGQSLLEQPWTVLAAKAFFKHGVPEPEHILLNQSLDFSSLHYTTWQHKVHQGSSSFSELQFAV